MKPCPAAHVRRRARTVALATATLTLVVSATAAAKPRDWDNDGLSNRAELVRKTNPWKKDSDRDGLRDGREVHRTHTKPRRFDSDRDGLGDGREVKRLHTNPRKRDTDGDRLSDGREVKKYKTNPRKKDTDGDGLNDRYELRKSRTNPRRKDTDRDGVSDGVEVLAGSNPRNRRSKPAPKPASPPPPAPGPPGVPNPVLPGLPALPACTTVVTSTAAAQSAVAGGGTVCLANGSYGSVKLSGGQPATLRPVTPGGATLAGATLSGSNLRLSAFVVNGQVQVASRSSNITIDRNDIYSAGMGVFLYGDQGGSSTPITNVYIGANRITGAGAGTSGENDLIRAHRFRGVVIAGNELRNINESGGHSDIFQSVQGGAGLVLTRNYVHQQGGTQGFFVKDGAVTNLTIEENLIVDDPKGNGYAISFYETSANAGDPHYTGYGAVVRRNTVWNDASGIAVRGQNTTTLVEYNVTTALLKESGTVVGGGNVVGGKPPFGANYLLANLAAGITWNLASQVYGPQN